MDSSAFVAYPSSPYIVGSSIRAASELANQRPGVTFSLWEENDIAGRPLTAPIFKGIEKAQLLVADVSTLNFNVTYEIGFSIGIGRRVFLIRNRSVNADEERIRKVGIFDTLGYEQYANEVDLSSSLLSIEDVTPLSTSYPLDRRAPVYFLETPIRTQALLRIAARIKKARLHYRSFSPSEDMRLSAVEAIQHVASSFGVIVPLLAPHAAGADIHNIRAAFVAGLAHGMGKVTLLLQDLDGPVPLDVRDFVKMYRHPNDIDEHIHSFSLNVYPTLQESDEIVLPKGKRLSRLTVGDPMAENEFQTLSRYYVQTDQFHRTLRGEVNLVVGRKGSGKTALFSQVRDAKRRKPNNIVVDLKPEGYQLIKLREQVIDYLSEGAKAHLITAFWEYLLCSEICYKLIEKDRERHMRDRDLYDRYRALAEIYSASPNLTEGDFSERLLVLSENISQSYRKKRGAHGEGRLTADDVTELLYSRDIRALREHVSAYLRSKDETWVLFDNLDKGWSTRGLVKGDILILRCLIDAARKIQREMRRDRHEFQTVVFVRNDVYELLMQESADFGKESRASLDWSDPDLLREMLRKRLVQNDLPADATFQQIWARVCVSHYKGEETSQYLIERSLMRPRNLLKIFGHCRGFAVNLDHERIESEDIDKGLKSYSDDLITDADLELTDIEPEATDLVYHFIGEKANLAREELEQILRASRISTGKIQQAVEFLLYYGVLGVQHGGDEARYIFDMGYDMRKMRILIEKHGKGLRYVVNPAFWPGLGISQSAATAA